MRDVETIKATLLQHKIELREKFKVKTIGVFGSYVRGEQKLSSDVDVLVEFNEPVGLFEFIKLENYLSDLLGVKVDLASKKALKPHIGEHIVQEVIMI
jgi:predicted nucleotidyltransferase